jgi:hypothetical protein
MAISFLMISLSPCTPDFTRLKLVKAKKIVQIAEEEARKEAEGLKCVKENDQDITAAFDATDDADVVF